MQFQMRPKQTKKDKTKTPETQRYLYKIKKHDNRRSDDDARRNLRHTVPHMTYGTSERTRIQYCTVDSPPKGQNLSLLESFVDLAASG